MKFNKSRVFTALNAEEAKIGIKGFFADDLESLKTAVTKGTDISTLRKINATDCTYTFENDGPYAWIFFYPAEEIKEVTAAEWDNRPRIMKVWDTDYSAAKELKVLAVRREKMFTCPVVTIDEDGETHAFLHCAELEPAKEAKEPKTGKFRPYGCAAEFIADYKKRFCSNFKNIPVIWVENKLGVLKQVVVIMDDGIILQGFLSYADFLKSYTYPDGSPCGIEK